ncbi:MAG: ABC transporter permease, partial [Pseudomonadota bacterium]
MISVARPAKGIWAQLPLLARVAMVWLLTIVAVTLLAFVWTPHNPTHIDIAARLRSPDFTHVFGTDHFGRDVLSMLMVGGRASLAIALGSVGLGMALGVPLGLLAAARRGL